MSNQKIYDLGINAELRKLTEASMLAAATKISGEDPSGGVTPPAGYPLGANQAGKRQALATRAINSPQNNAMVFVKAVAAQSGFYSVVEVINGDLVYTGAGTLDSDLDFTVNSIWDDVAGISYADKQI